MMSRFYNHGQRWYNNYATVRLAVFLLRKSNNTGIINYRPRPDKTASTVASERKVGNRGRFILQPNRKEKAQMSQASEPLEDHGMNVKNFTSRSIPSPPTSRKFLNVSLESPGNSPNFASDSMFLSVAGCNEPGRSAFYSPMAAPVADTLMPGAASPDRSNSRPGPTWAD